MTPTYATTLKIYDRSTNPGLYRELHSRALLKEEVLKAPDSPQRNSQSGRGRGHAVT